jgi:hypothetical protein
MNKETDHPSDVAEAALADTVADKSRRLTGGASP